MLTCTLLRNMRKSLKSTASWQERSEDKGKVEERVKSKMVGWECPSDCMDRQALSSAMLRVGWGSAHPCSGRRCLHEGGETCQQIKQKERQRTHGFPFGKGCLRGAPRTRSSLTTRYPTPLSTRGMQHCDASFALARPRNTRKNIFQTLVDENGETP